MATYSLGSAMKADGQWWTVYYKDGEPWKASHPEGGLIKAHRDTFVRWGPSAPGVALLAPEDVEACPHCGRYTGLCCDNRNGPLFEAMREAASIVCHRIAQEGQKSCAVTEAHRSWSRAFIRWEHSEEYKG